MFDATEKVVRAGLGAMDGRALAEAREEETIWGPVERVDPDGKRWIRATLLDDSVEVIEEEVLKAIGEDVVWGPSIQMARASLAKAHASATATPPATAPAAPSPAPVPAAPDPAMEDDDWMRDLDPSRRDDAQRGGLA